eukprot:2350121-Amphidinium_carterae.1
MTLEALDTCPPVAIHGIKCHTIPGIVRVGNERTLQRCRSCAGDSCAVASMLCIASLGGLPGSAWSVCGHWCDDANYQQQSPHRHNL